MKDKPKGVETTEWNRKFWFNPLIKHFSNDASSSCALLSDLTSTRGVVVFDNVLELCFDKKVFVFPFFQDKILQNIGKKVLVIPLPRMRRNCKGNIGSIVFVKVDSFNLSQKKEEFLWNRLHIVIIKQ